MTEPVATPAPGAGVALVTGARRGIGAHLAAAFQGAGYVVHGCSAQGDGTTRPGDPSGVAAVDVTDRDAVQRWVDAVLAREGRIDVLVNNAGVIDAEVPLEASDPDDWWRTVVVDVLGPYLVTRAVLPSMLEAGRGRIVNINSGSGTRAAEISSAYHVAKSALGRVTGATHLRGRGRGVFAFDLAPGVVRTDMTRAMHVHDGRTEWTEPEQVCELALALASGRLDAWSGRMVRAGADTPDVLAAAAARGLPEQARTVGLLPYGPDDPVA